MQDLLLEIKERGTLDTSTSPSLLFLSLCIGAGLVNSRPFHSQKTGRECIWRLSLWAMHKLLLACFAL